ncbi:hypothetical protein DFA_07415 [Cavenderia fasciculata]|uniref:Peptidase M66 domain-containing protein n=1 Tax=Cavenderia fasciculata TaxID=261658 RepID=F4PWC8_CACFS|nr:uncharacterized protein DFA_07415 [Cavenderia fasciculata]EGG20292.1 hypothetical protein DFA_07415 [Cavenderia fasciculata]|eukprot:XP_004367275.1 hypothetical protein DFA_07415 [Cavenderia fasciculata]
MKHFDILTKPSTWMEHKKVIIPVLTTVAVIVVLVIVLPIAIVFSNKDDGASGPTGTIVPNWLFAQSHVMPAQGLSWTLVKNNQSATYHLVGGKRTLVMVDFGSDSELKIENPTLVFTLPVHAQPTTSNETYVVGTIALVNATYLPKTEANGTAFSTTHYSAMAEADWIKPGLVISAFANDEQSTDIPVNVGQTVIMPLEIVPFYLFGATPANTNFSDVDLPPPEAIAELEQKWPISKLDVKTHPVGRIQWSKIIIGARDGNPPYAVTNTNQMKDGYAVMSAILGVLGGLRSVNGRGLERLQLYTPIIAFNNQSKYSHPGGGLGGGSSGTGDYAYSGIFIHEQGHAFGLPHAGGSYDSGYYPYIQGSLKGSQWGFDANHNEFLAPWIPANRTCGSGRVNDTEGHCYKQSDMQGGAGDQSWGYRFSMFADYEMSVIQDYFEGNTTLKADGTHQPGGALVYNPSNNTYSQWDTIYKAYVPYTITNQTNGLYGFDSGAPMIRNVPVYTIIMSYSTSGVTEASQIYPYLKYTGNIRRSVDPTNAEQLATIKPNVGPIAWYCHASGCDWTVRITYSDDSQQYILQQTGVRGWFSPFGAPTNASTDPLSGGSFFTFYNNVPATKAIKKSELLWTPFGFNGVYSNATVLLTKSD